MDISPLALARTHFLLSLGFHMLFLAIALALAWVLFGLKVRARVSGDAGWTAAYRFWVRFFALAFVLAQVSALPLLFQLGGLWPVMMERVGNVIGPLLGFAVVTVFVVKSCFLGVMLFGQRRVSDLAHTLAVLMVAAGLLLEVFWVVSLISWTHTPAGALLLDGRYIVTDWRAAVLNVSQPWLLASAVLGAALVVSFMMMGVTAWQALSRPLVPGEKMAFRCGLWLACVALVLQAAAGVGTARMIAAEQPAKAAAAAGYWHTGEVPRWVLFGWPDVREQRNHAEVALGSLSPRWLGVTADGKPQGLDKVSGMQPPVPGVFWSFRIMMAAGILMCLVAFITLLRLLRRRLDPSTLSRFWLRVLIGAAPLGAIACVAGWMFSELGRQPYAVYSTVTMSEVVGTTRASILGWSLAGHVLLYAGFLLAFCRMLFHAARYGVVPVRRPGARA